MSLVGTYKFRNKIKPEKPRKKQEQEQTSDNILAELKKIAISPELAAEWSENGCGRPC